MEQVSRKRNEGRVEVTTKVSDVWHGFVLLSSRESFIPIWLVLYGSGRLFHSLLGMSGD